MKVSLGAKTLIVPTPVWLIGTYDTQGAPNVMTVAWGGVCCSQPPCVAVSLRKATYSYSCLKSAEAFTVNVPGERLLKEADFCGIVSGREQNKFEKLGLTPVRGDKVEAPYVAECPLVLECRLAHTFELGLHTQFVGEILDVKADQEVLKEGRIPQVETIKPLVFDPATYGYYAVGGYLGKAFSVGKTG